MIKVINFKGVLRGEFWDLIFFVWKYIPIMIFFSLVSFNKNLFETLKNDIIVERAQNWKTDETASLKRSEKSYSKHFLPKLQREG